MIRTSRLLARGAWVPLALLVAAGCKRSEEHTSELQSQSNLVCRLLLEKKKAEPHRLPDLPGTDAGKFPIDTDPIGPLPTVLYQHATLALHRLDSAYALRCRLVSFVRHR